MANFTIRDFQTRVRTDGLARPNRFEVQIGVPRALLQLTREAPLISLFCESANLPVQNINVRQQRIYGPVYQRPVGTDYGGEGITLTFIVDNNMFVRGFFDAWLKAIVHPEEFYVHYKDNYVVPIRISQLNEQEAATYIVILEDAFPRSVSLMEVNNTTQNQVHKLTVNFAYRRWRSYHSTSDKVSLPVQNSYNFINPAQRETDVEIFAVPFENATYDATSVRKGNPLDIAGSYERTSFDPQTEETTTETIRFTESRR